MPKEVSQALSRCSTDAGKILELQEVASLDALDAYPKMEFRESPNLHIIYSGTALISGGLWGGLDGDSWPGEPSTHYAELQPLLSAKWAMGEIMQFSSKLTERPLSSHSPCVST